MQYSRWGPTSAEYSRTITSFDQLAVLRLMQPTRFPSNSFYSSQARGTRTVHLVGLKASLLEFYLTCVIVQQWENLTFGDSGCSWHRTIQEPITSQVHWSGSCLQELSAHKRPQYALADQTQVTYIIKPISTLTCKQQSLLKLPKLGKVCSTFKEPRLAKFSAVTQNSRILKFQSRKQVTYSRDVYWHPPREIKSHTL